MHYQNLALSVAKLPDEWVSICVGVSANPGGLVSQHQDINNNQYQKRVANTSSQADGLAWWGKFVAVKLETNTYNGFFFDHESK